MIKSVFFSLGIFLSLGISTLWAQQNAPRSGYQFKEIADLKATPVKNQANSGTCWCYATLSFLESELLRMGKPAYDLSEMYTVRNAYFEKGMRYFRLYGKNNLNEGGQAHDVVEMIAKYGIVPEEVYPGLEYGVDQNNHSEMVSGLIGYMSGITKARNITTAWPKALMSIIESYLGRAPEKFTFQGQEYTPQTFAQELGIRPEDYIELTSYEAYPFYEQVELEIPDNWMHARYYNVPLDDLIAIMQNALKNGYTIAWDGDVSEQGFSHAKGLAILPTNEPQNMSGSDRARFEKLPEAEKNNLYSFVAPVPEMQVNDQNRQETFDKRKTTDDHLMHLTGLLQDQNGTYYYKTKNSWGTERNPFGGYLYMSEPYVKMKTVAILLHKDAIPQNIKEKLKLN